jgi:hypothetical protein
VSRFTQVSTPAASSARIAPIINAVALAGIVVVACAQVGTIEEGEVKIQKWEYAYIAWWVGAEPTKGERTLTLENARNPGLFKKGDIRRQIKEWIKILGQDG